MPDRGFPTPVRTAANSVWAIAPIDNGDVDYGTTGIWHADIDCPSIRDWRAAAGTRASTIMEINRRESTFFEWVLYDSGWELLNETNHRMDLTTWRACLRCGTVDKEPTHVCRHCFLTICDCASE